jgi:Calpain family cysteine protease
MVTEVNRNSDNHAATPDNLAAQQQMHSALFQRTMTSLTDPAKESPAKQSSDTLFGPPGHQDISYRDINQNGVGDCYLLSSLGEIAKNDPNFIRQMIHNNGNGTYTVTLYKQDNGFHNLWGLTGNSYKSEKVTVSEKDIAPNGVNANPGQDVIDGQKEIWPQVVEAAYAKLNGGYDKIGKGGVPSNAMETLTGHDASSGNTTSFAQLQQSLNQGKLITLDTPDKKSLPYNLVGDHAYMVVGTLTDSHGNQFVKLQNPWGYSQPSLVPVSAWGKVFDQEDVGVA